MRLVVHGDDFTILGNDDQLDWIRTRMQERYTLKTRGRLGPEPEDDKEIRILNRILQWNQEGIWYEPDPRHVEIILKDLGLTGTSKRLSLPGEPAKPITDDDEELDEVESTQYRALVARGLYLSQDRSDIQYAVKELSRYMSKPRKSDQERLKKLGRYLAGRPRVRTLFGYQGKVNQIDTYVDTD